MKKAILSLCIAAMTAASLTLPASAADLMTFRFGAEKTAVSTDELAKGDVVIPGGLYIDNYTGIAQLRMILRSTEPILIENGRYTPDPNGALDDDGLVRDAFFEKHSTHFYTQKSEIDDDTNIILWAGEETEKAGEFHANGVVRNANSSFLSFDYRIPKDTRPGDYSCYVSERVITNSIGVPEEDLRISDSKHQLKLGEEFALRPLTISVYMRGDANCDGKVEIEDAQAALVLYTEQKVTGLELSNEDLAGILKTKSIAAGKLGADASQDGSIDVTDPQGILDYYVRAMIGSAPAWSEIYKK